MEPGDPNGYHHPNPHHRHQQQQQQQQQQPSPRLSAYGHPAEEPVGGRVMDHYGDRYAECVPRHAEPHAHAHHDDQPLDLTVPSSRPRPGSAGSQSNNASNSGLIFHHHQHDGGMGSTDPSRTGGGGSGIGSQAVSSSLLPMHGSHPGVCTLKGCGCANAAPSSHHPAPHTPHYSGNRHSPYPRPYSPPRGGHRSPGVSSELTGHSYAPPSMATPPGAMIAHDRQGSGSPYYMDRRCRSPLGGGSYMPQSSLSPYPSDSMMRQGPSPSSSLLYPPPPHSSASSHTLSPRSRGADRDSSPRPSNHTSPGRVRDVSPRPLYRPFEESPMTRAASMSSMETTSFSSLATTISSSMSVLERYKHTSEDDLTASSSLLLLSRPPAPPTAAEIHQRDYAMEEEERRHRDRMMEIEEHADRPSQSDNMMQYHQLAPVAPHSSYYPNPQQSTMDGYRSAMESPRQRGGVVERSQPSSSSMPSSGPAQDHTVASSSSLSPKPDNDLSNSSAPRPPPPSIAAKQGEAHSSPNVSSSNNSSNNNNSMVPHPAARRPGLKVVGTTDLAIAREKRVQRQMKQKENMKNLIQQAGESSSSGPRMFNNFNAADAAAADSGVGELGGAADLNSTGQPSPGASSSSTTSNEENGMDVGKEFPIPPDPNLRMSALDYLISEFLVRQRDVPFKPFNKEVNDIYTGVKKGRLSLVDLIELRVEASLKAS